MDRIRSLAHIDHDTGREQTLFCHSESTAVLCKEFCKRILLESLGELIGLLHDSGKGTRNFQNYLWSDNPALRGRIPHSFCGARYCCLTWGGATDKDLTAELAAAAICAHHGGLPDVTGIHAEDVLHKRAWPETEPPYQEALENFLQDVSRKELDALFEKARREVKQLCLRLRELCGETPPAYRKKTFYFQLGLVQRYLLSCLIDADRYDTFLFASGKKPEPKPDLPVLWNTLAQNLETFLQRFPTAAPIDKKRHKISEQCYEFRGHASGIFRLSVPTGSGKTMASLRYAINCAKENRKERIFYIAPYKSILEQNAEDIREALDIRDDRILLEHHSDVVIDDKETEEIERYRLLTQRWESPVVLTTAVQFLNTLFDGRSSCVRRMHSLANSVIILDEFQAFPVKCTGMLNAALNFLAYACGCAVVLCTATQPNSEELPVPVVFGKPAQMTQNPEETFAAFRRTRIIDKTPDGPLSGEQLAEFALERTASCDNLLMILNTKAAANSVFRALKERMALLPTEERFPLYYLTTSQCPQHRIDLIDEIKRRLKNKTPGANRIICVSTQLIEAGVNLSFQCAVRSLAGLDSVAQAAGRCNRHQESACRDVFIVRCEEENLSRLPDIKNAQEAASHVLQDYAANPAQFHGDPLSNQAIRRYYRYYFDLQKPQLFYPVGEKEDPKLFAPTDLFDLLSVNSLAAKYCAEHGGSMPRHPLHQAFETAGRLFEAIEKGGMDVVVPYGEGKKLIETLRARPAISELPTLLRKAQRYSVHLFDGERIRLGEAGAIDGDLMDMGVAILQKEFYSGELGVQTQRREMEPLLL